MKNEERSILVLGDVGYYPPFEEFGIVRSPKKAQPSMKEIKSADLIVFTGGADVSPTLYKEREYQYTKPNLLRDRGEAQIFDIALDNKIPMAGICRGSQFLTVMCGGKLVQHVTNHGEAHEIVTNNQQKLRVTSTHHQMMNPWQKGVQFELLAWAVSRSDSYFRGDGSQAFSAREFVTEPEAVWYPKEQCLAVQYHPEYMSSASDGFQYYKELLEEYVIK